MTNLDINSSSDRKKFEEEHLYPALNIIYSNDIWGHRIPIISGSAALYLHGIYLDHFPLDIDIRFDGYNDIKKYKFLYRNLCKKYGFTIDFLGQWIDPIYKTITYDINNVKVIVQTIEDLIYYQHKLYLRWIEYNNPDKAQKYLEHYNYIKEHYPQYFTENAEA